MTGWQRALASSSRAAGTTRPRPRRRASLDRPGVRRRAGSRRSSCSAGCARGAATPSAGRRSTRRSSSRAATGELQRLAPVAAARAEARWLGGRARARRRRDRRARSRWRSSTATAGRRRAARLAPPRRARRRRRRRGRRRAVRARARGRAAAAAERLGGARLPVRGGARARPTPTTRRRCGARLDELQRLGARAGRRARRARAARARRARRRRRARAPPTRANPAGLTRASSRCWRSSPRACATPRSPRGSCSREKTVAHHVSAILRKLGVRTRSQAVAEAGRLGIARKIGSPPDVAAGAAPSVVARSTSDMEDTMKLYAILRRSGWALRPPSSSEAAARSTQVGDEEMPDDVRWIRSYVLDEGGGTRRHGLHLRGHEPRGDPRARRRAPTCPSTRSSASPTPSSCGPTRSPRRPDATARGSLSGAGGGDHAVVATGGPPRSGRPPAPGGHHDRREGAQGAGPRTARSPRRPRRAP